MEDYGDYLYVVLKTLFMAGDRGDEVESEQVSVILGRNFVLSFQEKENPLFEPIRERLRNGKGRLRKMGPDYLVHAVLDAIIDHYFVVLEKLGEKIEFLEEEVVIQPTPDPLQAHHRLEREIIFNAKPFGRCGK